LLERFFVWTILKAELCQVYNPSTDSQVAQMNGPTATSEGVWVDRQSTDIYGNPESASFNILFVGNSLTYYNDLPKLVYEYAKTKKKKRLVRK